MTEDTRMPKNWKVYKTKSCSLAHCKDCNLNLYSRDNLNSNRNVNVYRK